MTGRFATKWCPYRNQWVVVDLEDSEKVLLITDWWRDAMEQMVALEEEYSGERDIMAGVPVIRE